MPIIPPSPDRARSLLAALALLCRNLSWFPVWMLLLSLTPRGDFLLCAAILAVCGMLISLLARHVQLRYRIETGKRNLLTVCTAVPLTAAMLGLIDLRCGGLTVSVILAALQSFTALRRVSEDADELYTVRGYAAFLTGAVLVPVMMHFAEQYVPVNLLLADVGAVSAGFFLLRNQLMLLRLVNRRTNIDTDVPQEIRRGNLLLLLGLAAALAVVFIFRAPLLSLLNMMEHTAIWAAEMLLRGIARLIVWLGGDAPAEPAEAAPVIDRDALQYGKASPLWLLLWIPFIAVALYVWHVFLSDWFEAIRDAFGALITRLTHAAAGGGANPRTAFAEYTDTESSARPASKGKQRRSWKKQVRKWQRMPDDDPEKKFYAGYQLLLASPAWGTGLLRESDTPLAICGKWGKVDGKAPALLRPVTDDLHAERYAETGLPENALRDLEETLSAMQ